jgi:hypothetical protein
MSEAVEDLGKALLAIEDAWATLALEKSSALVTRERELRGIEGDMQAGQPED